MRNQIWSWIKHSISFANDVRDQNKSHGKTFVRPPAVDFGKSNLPSCGAVAKPTVSTGCRPHVNYTSQGGKQKKQVSYSYPGGRAEQPTQKHRYNRHLMIPFFLMNFPLKMVGKSEGSKQWTQKLKAHFLGGGFKYLNIFSPRKLGKMIQFNIFQMGWWKNSTNQILGKNYPFLNSSCFFSVDVCCAATGVLGASTYSPNFQTNDGLVVKNRMPRCDPWGTNGI